MAVNELSTKLTNDASQFNQSLDEATGKVEKFQDKVDDAVDSVEDLGKKGAMSTKDLLKELGKFSGAEKGVSNYRRQLGQMTKDIQDLTINYRKLTDEQKNSDVGRAALQRIQELTKKASEYKDAISDAQAAMKAMASDTANLDAMKSGLDLISGAMQGIASAGFLGAESSEDLLKVIAKLKAIESGFGGAIKIVNNLQRDSALIQGIVRVQMAAATKATELQTVALGKQTIAQKALNLVAKANPYVLLASAIAAVAVAVGAWMLASKRNLSIQEQLLKSQEAINKAMNDAVDDTAELVGKFKSLEAQYRSLKTEAEKQQWIDEHQEAFKELGYSIEDVNDADSIFVQHAADVIKAMRLRAEAAAMMAQYQKEYAEWYKKQREMEQKGENAPKTPQLSTANLEKAGLKYGTDYTIQSNTSPVPGGVTTSTPILTDEGRQKWNDYWKAQAQANEEAWDANMAPMMEQIQKKEADALALDGKWRTKPTTKPTTPNKPDNPSVTIKNEIDLLEKENAALKELMKTVPHLSDEWKEYDTRLQGNLKRIEELKKAEEAWRASLKSRPSWESLVMPSNQISGPSQLPTGNPKITFDPDINLKRLRDEVAKAQDLADTINEKFRLGLLDEDVARQLIDNINAALESEGIKVKVEFEYDEQKQPEEKGPTFGGLVNGLDNIRGIAQGTVGSFSEIYDAIDSLDDKLSEAENEWESFFAVFDSGIKVLSAVTTVIETIGRAMDILGVTQAANIAVNEADASAQKKDAEAKTENAVASIGLAAASGAEAGAKGAASVASIPYVGPILAVAAILSIMGAVIAMISQAKGFATGGVVGGTSYTGDKILARLNSGELVLNQQQQNKLLQKLDSNVVAETNHNAFNIPDKITLTAHGRDLQATLTNISKFNGKI